MKVERWWKGVAILAVVIAGGIFVWLWFQQPALPDGFASGNGRIEAIEVDVATKWAGRIKAVLANEGDLVEAGQVVARMDTATLEAQLRQAEAQVKQARDARVSVAALVSQRQSELAFTDKDLGRALELTTKGFVSKQEADLKRTKQETATAAVAAAKAQLIEAERIGLGARTLSRRLAVEGASFRQLREEACYTLACQFLESTHLPANEIADLLGYANPSAFTRAFYRWTGMGPAQWRASRCGPFL